MNVLVPRGRLTRVCVGALTVHIALDRRIKSRVLSRLNLSQHARIWSRQEPRPHGHSVARSGHRALIALMLVLVPAVVAACPPDPAWIIGVYDAVDNDDAATLLGEQTANGANVIEDIVLPLWPSRTVLLPAASDAQRFPVQPLYRGPPGSPYLGVIARALRTHSGPPAPTRSAHLPSRTSPVPRSEQAEATRLTMGPGSELFYAGSPQHRKPAPSTNPGPPWIRELATGVCTSRLRPSTLQLTSTAAEMQGEGDALICGILSPS